MTIMILNAATGEVIERQRTIEEEAQHEVDKADAAKAQKDWVKKEAADKAAKQAAIAHAKTLGFTDVMIAVMYPNLEA